MDPGRYPTTDVDLGGIAMSEVEQGDFHSQAASVNNNVV